MGTAGDNAQNSTLTLLANEQVSFEDESTGTKESDEALNNRYAKGDVRIVTESARYSLAGILQMLQETVEVHVEPTEPPRRELRYKLDPEYQRRHRWSVERKSRLIESFLMNVPVPPVFLYERDLARFEVMDGRQRLTALSEFYSNKFELRGLKYWGDLDGRTYATLPGKVRDGIDRRYISSVILLKETAATDEQAALLKKIVFERLNSGGVELGNQETRNAIYNGPLNKLCLELSENEHFRRLWGIPQSTEELESAAENEDVDEEPVDESTRAGQKMFERMEDVELVLRFFAYRQISSFKAGLNRLSDFLDRFLLKGNSFPPDLIDTYRDMFTSVVEFLSQVLPNDAYCVLPKGRPTKIVYDPIMYTANLDEVRENYKLLVDQKHILRECLVAQYSEDAPMFSGRRTNFIDTQARNASVKKAFLAAIVKAKAAKGS